MATQANYDALAAALAAESEADVSKYGGALLGELKAAQPKPTGGELADPETWSGNRGVKNLVRGVNKLLGF